MKNRKVYYPQLDSLRAIAVILVIISHWFDSGHILNRYQPNGILGVTLFFVLSGFLITGILLKSKNIIEEGGSAIKAFGVFYMRRSLRIFPIYYILLILLLVLASTNLISLYPEFLNDFWWHFFYGSNFLFWITGKFAGQLSHFWSLAVEEQFYLIWPSVIFFVPLRKLQAIFISGIIIAVLFRLGITTLTNDMGRLLMPGSLDSFCIGGLLAYGITVKTRWYLIFTKFKDFFVGLSFVLFILIHFLLRKTPGVLFSMGLYFLIISLIFGIWIDKVAEGVNNGFFKYLLNNRILLFIGKISYGIYLFHNFIPYFYGIEFPAFLSPYSFYIIQLLRFAVVIALSSISWFIIEKPILRLKSYFEYNKKEVKECPVVSL